eukprot:sb/3470897/
METITTILLIAQITLLLLLVALVIALIIRQQRSVSQLETSLRLEIASLDADFHQLYNTNMPDWYKLNTQKFCDQIDANFKTLSNQNKVNHDSLRVLNAGQGSLKQRQRDIITQVQSLYQVMAVQIPRMIKAHLSSQRPASTPAPTPPTIAKPDCFDVEAQTGQNPVIDHETQTFFTTCCDVEAQTDYTVLQLGED